MPLVSIATILTAILSPRLALRISGKQQANYVTLLKEALEILCNFYAWRLTSRSSIVWFEQSCFTLKLYIFSSLSGIPETSDIYHYHSWIAPIIE
jgi:hypothetical protein